MPIQSRRISDDRKRQAAQGRLWSAGKRNVVQAEDTSSTSSEDEGSVRSAKAQQSAAPQQPKSFVDPNEDFAQATKRAALQEWLFATGQSVPAPPSKAKPADIGSPASVRSRHTVKESTAPPPTATVAPVVKHDTPSNTRDPSAVLARKPQQPSQIQQTSGVEASTAIKPQDADHDAPAVTEVEPPSVPPATEVTDEEEAAHPGRRDFLKLLDLLGKEDKKKPPVAEEQPATTAPALARPALSADVDRRASMTLEQLTEHHFDRLYKEWIDSEADVRFVAVDEWNKAEALAHLERADTMDIALMHQQLRQRNTSQQTELDRQLAHDAALTRLEAYVISDGFVRRVNQFLHKHHLMFLASKPARERGEHQHKEYDVWQSYGQLTEQLIVGDLKRHIPGFQEAEFFEALFESTEEGVGSSTRQTIAGLSLEAWEVILSFLRFEHFSELMDEYINVHYGIREGGETGMGAVNALRRTSPPPTSVTTTGQVSGSESRTAPAVGAARRTTPAVGASKPKGGVSVKPR